MVFIFGQLTHIPYNFDIFKRCWLCSSVDVWIGFSYSGDGGCVLHEGHIPHGSGNFICISVFETVVFFKTLGRGSGPETEFTYNVVLHPDDLVILFL